MKKSTEVLFETYKDKLKPVFEDESRLEAVRQKVTTFVADALLDTVGLDHSRVERIVLGFDIAIIMTQSEEAMDDIGGWIQKPCVEIGRYANGTRLLASRRPQFLNVFYIDIEEGPAGRERRNRTNKEFTYGDEMYTPDEEEVLLTALSEE